jgi:hypothetical protein
MRALIHATNLEAKLRHLASVVEAKFDPNQPRVPAGNPAGGQWADGSGGDADSGAQRVGEANSERERLREFGSARRISIGLEDECWAQHMRDIFQCRMVGLRACYEQAALRYANCLVRLPIPPLNY